ncbi:M24 family metallopeptidase [Desulfosporosinus shakirovi]|uniref:M24 family metallopeptidase n=1 Tax=Desulfosporosinus shakirovi TaxID=2885154 RepID=UPI001E5CE4DF|nr:M24 family metallopeptidase [Desulfosporosinus sp. SRJS8]MCB8818173.1 M24 family metallopeptidase [Desulfosporosinus sp. SRJS8]
MVTVVNGYQIDQTRTISRGSKEVLKSGMVVAIEPKFVFPSVGVVGIEDTVVIEAELGARYLSVTLRELMVLRNESVHLAISC